MRHFTRPVFTIAPSLACDNSLPACFNQFIRSSPVTREARAPRHSRLALKGEERMGDERGQPSSQQPTDSAHDITQYRLDRRDIVGIASLLTHIILATVSIPLAGRRLRRRARILRLHTYFATTAPRASSPSEPSSANQLRLRRSGGLNEKESSCEAEARLTQIAPCQRGGRRQQRKSSTQEPSKGDSKQERHSRAALLIACP